MTRKSKTKKDKVVVDLKVAVPVALLGLVLWLGWTLDQRVSQIEKFNRALIQILEQGH